MKKDVKDVRDDKVSIKIEELKEQYDFPSQGPRVIVPSGCLTLDLASRLGGVPRGCTIDLYGEEGLGKTTLALTLVSERIKAKERCVYLDVEHRLDPELIGIICGDDWEEYMSVMQPKDAESALTEVIELTKIPEVKMIVLDSVAALVPKHCMDENEKEQTAEIARLMSSHLKMVSPIRYNNQTILLYINQIRSRPMVIGPVTSQPTGGRALKFYSDLRLNIIRNTFIREGEHVAGQKVDLMVEKNRFGPPHGRATMSIIFGTGLDKMRELIDWGLDLAIIRKSSSWYYYEETLEDGTKKEYKGNGEVALIEQIMPIYDKIAAQIRATELGKDNKEKADEPKVG